jgi:cystathionine beta-lyase family protein involved in aluminum resistance
MDLLQNEHVVNCRFESVSTYRYRSQDFSHEEQVHAENMDAPAAVIQKIITMTARIQAIFVAAPAMPVKPKTAAISAMTRKIIAHLNIIPPLR